MGAFGDTLYGREDEKVVLNIAVDHRGHHNKSGSRFRVTGLTEKKVKTKHVFIFICA